jgi:surface polysaccharide O-acyltransferase-like enzyme
METSTNYLNTLRVFACFAVIMIHVFSPINAYYVSSLTDIEAHISVILRNLWQWCVPIFVMITGVVFLDKQKRIPVSKILNKYFLRILLAIIIFGTFYSFLEIFFKANYIFSFEQLGNAILNVIQDKSWDFFWYLYMIAGLYLFIPFIKIFISYSERKTIEYVLIVLFIFGSIIPALEMIFLFKFGITIPVNSIYVFYLILGYYIHNYKINVSYGLLLVIMAIYFLYVILMSLNSKFVEQPGGGLLFMEYNSPIVVLSAFGVFCTFRQRNRANKIFGMLSPLCFGVYLVHVLFINFMYKFVKFTPENYPFMAVITGVLIIDILLSILFTFFARKISIVRKYIL